MKKSKNKLYLTLGILLGITLSATGVYAATTILSKDISYDNTSSGLSATNLQDAIDETYTKAQTNCPNGKVCVDQNENIVAAYTYNSGSCITGEESGCVVTNCYTNSASGSCPAGTIIKYNVSAAETKYFHVLHDDGETITMQQRENTVYNLVWNTDNEMSGPTTILPALESETSGWSNVNYQTYTLGTTVLYDNAYTGCRLNVIPNLVCDANSYTLSQRTGKARLITGQEAIKLGCKEEVSQSCPNWMNNYLQDSTSYGGTVNVPNEEISAEEAAYDSYWTMSGNHVYTASIAPAAWRITNHGEIRNGLVINLHGARAVVVIDK